MRGKPTADKLRHRSVRQTSQLNKIERDLYRVFPQLPKSHPHYAIPIGLLEAITKEAPSFFSQKERVLEAALSLDCSAGLFKGKRFRFPILEPSPGDSAAAGYPTLAETALLRSSSSDQNARDVWNTVLAERSFSNSIRIRQQAYIGWLLTDSGFNRERALFRSHFGREFEAKWPYPPRTFGANIGEKKATPNNERAFAGAYYSFCEKWGLSHLETWDLASPISPDVMTSPHYFGSYPGKSGCVVFVPWYLTRDDLISIREVVAIKSLDSSLQHLSSWLRGYPITEPSPCKHS